MLGRAKNLRFNQGWGVGEFLPTPYSRLLIPPKFSKLLLPTPSKEFYFIAIKKYIIPFYAIYYYFHSLIASNKYRNMFIRLILLILVTNCENFQFFNFIY